jgi:hypothetical protein
MTLVDVESAISTILAGGQEVRLPNGTTYKRAQLPELMRLRDTLKAEAVQETAGTFMPIRYGGMSS